MKLFFTITSSVVIMDTSNKKIIDIREKKEKMLEVSWVVLYNTKVSQKCILYVFS